MFKKPKLLFAQEVIASFNETFKCPAIEVSPSARLVEDLCLDSLDIVELALALEDEYSVDIFDSELDAVRTLQDLLNASALQNIK